MLWWIGNGIRESGSGEYIMKCFKWTESALVMVGAGMKSGRMEPAEIGSVWNGSLFTNCSMAAW